jgi:tetratricopeptide (TPR) repeat protein
MASLIPEYNYDIFISYRQKDNKGDRWVSEFVDALKTELESTFKEEISVYFDINPHDGLLETHDVDASLKDKLKCLVFIPIISRTYCDPKSFAWEHEFKAFVEQASQDQFGLKVKLPNGNVASRVLPVRIHDLDIADIKLYESVLGGVLRGIEFIYKEPGVNKPLTADDDEKKNINNTKYRIQINKVANAIKEIVQGMKAEPFLAAKEKIDQKNPLEENKIEERKEVQEKFAKFSKRKLLPGILITAILIIAAILAYPKIFKRNTLEKLQSSGKRISVAVMPFQNMTNDTIWNVWQDGIQEILTNLFSNSEELEVIQSESINAIIQNKGLDNNASLTPSLAGIISKKLDANVFIFGNIIQGGSSIRLYAKLIDSKTGEVVKSFQVEGPSKEEAIIPMIDSLSFMTRNFLLISELQKGNIEFKNLAFTSSPEAYRYFILGKSAYYEERDNRAAVTWFKQALAIDSNFIWAARFISIADQNIAWEDGKKWCLWVYKKKDKMTFQQKLWTDKLYAEYFGTPDDAIKSLRQLEELDGQEPLVYYNLGLNYHRLSQYDKAIPEYEKALEIYKKWNTKPLGPAYYLQLGSAYHQTHQYKKERMLYKKAEQDFPDDFILVQYQIILSLTEGDTVAANRLFERYKTVRKDQSWSEASTKSYMAYFYSEAGMLDKAEEYYRELLSLQPDNAYTKYSLADFLISKERNLNQGLELLDQIIKLYPNSYQSNYQFLDCYGWGLYKQGKYKEALEMLQKSWDLRRHNTLYDHEAFLHLEAAKKAVASQKNN